MDLSIFEPYIEKGLVNRKISPCGNLVLYDYTDKCVYERAWDNVTLNARGSVYELSTGNLVAKAFPKFFNFSELSTNEQNKLLEQDYFEVYEKMDGSLGIVYFYNNEWRVNTRGSFISDQAVKGKELLKVHESSLNKNLTYLVEIIYPSNRIVVDYRKEEKLVLLAAYHTTLGIPMDCDSYLSGSLERVNKYDFSSINDVIKKLSELTYNEEGYVVEFSNGSRAKFKGNEYLKMHKIVTGISPLVIWEALKNRTLDSLMEAIPEEFREEYETIAEKLKTTFLSIRYEILSDYNLTVEHIFGNCDYELTQNEDFKKLGLYLKDNTIRNSQLFFYIAKKDFKGLNDKVYTIIRPTGNNL